MAKKNVIFLLLFLNIQAIYAQKIEGSFDEKFNKFIIKENPNYQSNFKVEREAYKSYYNLLINEREKYRVIIDTIGNILFKIPFSECNNYNNNNFFSTKNGEYYGANCHNYESKYLIVKLRDSILTKCNQKILFMSSNDTSDLFFLSYEESFYEKTKILGEIISIGNNKKVNILERDTFYLLNTFSTKLDEDNGDFEKVIGKIVTKDKLNMFHIRDVSLNPIYPNLNIVEVLKADTLAFVSKNENNSYSLFYSDSFVSLFDTFPKYIKFNKGEQYDIHHLLFKNNNKYGAIIPTEYYHYNNTKFGILKVNPLYDTVIYNYDLIRKKNDTFFYNTRFNINYQKKQILNDTFFNKAYNKRFKLIGENNKYEFKKEKFSIEKPDLGAFWVGTNYNIHRFKNNITNDTFRLNAVNLEAGFGYYVGRTNGGSLAGIWTIGGGGIGLEYKFTDLNKKEFEKRTGQKIHPFLINARIEGAIGVHVLGFPIGSIHTHLGYTTNFNKNFIRPGIGVSIYNLQCGIETMMPMNKDFFKYPYVGYYARFIILEFDSN